MKKLFTVAFLLCLFFNTGFSQEDPVGQGGNNEEPWPCISWCTSGNSNTGGGYLGTNDGLPLIFRTDKLERMRITEIGEVGIGINSPQSQLDVATSIRTSDPNSFNYLELFANPSGASITTMEDFYLWNAGNQSFISGNNFNVYTPASSHPALTILGSNGRVGIGTNTPTEELDVSGNIKFGVNLSGVNSTKRTTFSYDTPFTGAYVRLYSENHSSTPGRMSLVANSRNGGGEIAFLDYDGSTYQESMVIKAGGNIGIGTGTPQANLHVSGDVRLDNLSTSSSSTVVVADNNGNLGNRSIPANIWDGDDDNQTLSISGNALSINNGNTVTLPSGGDDLGNHTATTDLDMQGNDIHDVGTLRLGNFGSTDRIEFEGGNGPYLMNNQPIDGLEIQADHVSIGGPVDPTYGLSINFSTVINGPLRMYGNLDVHGTPWTSNNTWTTSDRRFKKNINDIDSALDKIMQIEGKIYQYKTEEFKYKNFIDTYTYGFIAQDLKEVLPEVVRKDSEGYFGVAYSQLVPVLTEAIKEQNQIVTIQQEEIEELENRITRLESLISTIQNNTSGATDQSGLQNQQPTIKDPAEMLDSSDSFLSNNIPNPFLEETSVQYTIAASDEGKTMSILIHDASGRLVYSADTTAVAGKGEMPIKGEHLNTGLHFYSLVIDGKVIATKSMLKVNN